MKCHMCGGKLQAIITDLPFKLNQKTIAILRDLPVLQCESCSEYLIEDAVMERVEAMMSRMDREAELEIMRYAA